MIHLLSYFYPRSPCGERRYWPCVHVVGRAISIHALLAESDALAPEENPTQKNFYPRSPCGERLLEQSASYNAALENFYPRSPCGERPDTSIIILDEYQFLSTLSLRRATDDLQVPASVSKISIHALLAESDRLIPSLSTMLFDFYPRSPCGERLYANFSGFYWWIISIHALLAESDGCQRPCERPTTNFYPRSPCGERHIRANFCLLVYYFYPRSPCGERLYCHCWHLLLQKISIHALLAESDIELAFLAINPITFLSTLSLRRATPGAKSTTPERYYFYPRSPCGERRRQRPGS